MPEGRHYQVFAARTRSGQPILVHRNILTQKRAIVAAKAYHAAHPDRYVGVFELLRIRTWKPVKKK